jgi:hypothetical protein
MKWINTKVEFAWNSKEKKYVETDVEGYHYVGEVAQCGGGGDSFGSGELVTISGSLEGISHVSMSVGDKVLSANITGLPDTDVASEYLLWEYTGSNPAEFTSSQITLATSSIESITTHSRAPNAEGVYKLVCENGREDDIIVTGAHPFLVYSGSSQADSDGVYPGAWYFEYTEDINANMKLLSSSLEPVTINSITSWTASNAQSQSYFRFDIEPYDVYFVEGVLVHN